MHPIGRLICVAFLATLVSASRSAAQTTFEFTGEIVSVQGIKWTSSGSPVWVDEVDGIAAGDAFSGSLTYDAAAGIDRDDSPSRGLYFFDPPLLETLRLTVSGRTCASDPGRLGGAEVRLGTTSELSADTDAFELFSSAPILPAGWGSSFPAGIQISALFRDGSGTALASDALPEEFSPHAWEDADIVLTAFQISTPDGDVEELQIVGRIHLPRVLEVVLDVHPGSRINPVNLKSRGALPVGLLSTESADATQIDPETLRLGDPLLMGDGATGAAPWKWKVTDLNRDGLPDLMLHFWTQDLVAGGVIEPQTELLGVMGMTFDGTQAIGVDDVKVLAPPSKSPEARPPKKPKSGPAGKNDRRDD